MAQIFNALQLHSEDNVAVALKSLRAGDILMVQSSDQQHKIEVIDNIPYGHKIAIVGISKHSKIFKYGECMGVSTKNIKVGSHVHVSNVRGLTESDKEELNNLS